MLSTLDEAVEVVGIDSDLMLDCRQPKGLLEVVGDEAGVGDALRQVTLADAEHDHVVEVEGTCLEYTHHL